MPIKAESGRTLRVYNPEEKANNAKKKNERDLAISQSYFDQAPSVQNIIRGIYHWARGSEWSPFSRSEDPDDYKYNAGTIPIVVAPARVAGAVVQSIPRWLNPKAVATTAAIGTAASQVSNRPRVMPISRSVDMASEVPTDSISPSPEASTQNAGSSTEAPQTPNDNNEQNKRGWRDRVANKVDKIIRGRKPQKQKPSNSEQPKNPKPLRKTAWNVYKWSWYVPTAIDVIGNVAGAAKNSDTYSPVFRALDYRTRPLRATWNFLGEYYNPQASTADSTTVTPPNNPDNQPKADQDTVVVYPLTEEDKKGYEKDSANYAKKLIDAKRAAAIELARDTL